MRHLPMWLFAAFCLIGLTDLARGQSGTSPMAPSGTDAIDIYLAAGPLRDAVSGLVLAAGLTPQIAIDPAATLSARRVRGSLGLALDQLAAEKDFIWVSTGSTIYAGLRARAASATFKFPETDAAAVRRQLVRLNLETRPDLVVFDATRNELRVRGPEPFVEMIRTELRSFEARTDPAPADLRVIRFGKSGALE